MPETLEEIKKYVGPFNGPQMDQIFYEILNYTSERYAKGTANGLPAAPGTPGYQDNSLYYKNQAAAQATAAANSAAVAENAAERAESAVPVGTDSAVLYTRAQTLTAAQAAQARANIRASGSNPNLLDNWWWGIGVVNQRNISSAPANQSYCIDRWKYSSGDGRNTIALHSDGITLGITAGGIWMTQKFEHPTSLVGKTLTASALLSDGTIYSGTATIQADTTIFFYNANSLRLYMDADCNFVVSPLQTKTILAVKLELGEVSTLENDAPPNYAEELAKCQYYLHPIEGIGYGKLGIATAATAIRVPIPCVMRAVPTITYTGSFTAIGEGQALGVTSITVTNKGADVVELNCTVSGATIYGIYFLTMTAGSKILLSADL